MYSCVADNHFFSGAESFAASDFCADSNNVCALFGTAVAVPFFVLAFVVIVAVISLISVLGLISVIIIALFAHRVYKGKIGC